MPPQQIALILRVRRSDQEAALSLGTEDAAYAEPGPGALPGIHYEQGLVAVADGQRGRQDIEEKGQKCV